MFIHRPDGYNCPFCAIINQLQERCDIIYHDDLVTALVPLHHFAKIKGNVLVIPNTHYENIFDIDYHIGAELLRVIQRIAYAMKSTYNCDGISTRQHNEPAGYQDVWHYHVHVFPRYTGDNFYAGNKEQYDPEERFHHAQLLREHLQMDKK